MTLSHAGQLLFPHAPQGLAAVVAAGVSQLTPAHAVDAAWGLGVMGAADKVWHEIARRMCLLPLLPVDS